MRAIAVATVATAHEVSASGEMRCPNRRRNSGIENPSNKNARGLLVMALAAYAVNY